MESYTSHANIQSVSGLLDLESLIPAVVLFSTYHLIFSVWFEPGDWNKFIDFLLNLLDKYGLGEKALLFIFGSGSTIVFYYLASGAYALLELIASKSFLNKHKIQGGRTIDKSKMKAIYNQVFFNNFIVMPLTSGAYTLLLLCVHSKEKILFSPPPSWYTAVAHFVFFLAVESFLFYHLHIFLHKNRFLYKKIHKRHHELYAPIGIAAVYAHPLEHAFVNIMPVMIGPFILGSHIAISILWFSAVEINTVISHSGYKFYCLDGTDHDQHHQYSDCNFGIYFFDWFYGTTRKAKKPKISGSD